MFEGRWEKGCFQASKHTFRPCHLTSYTVNHILREVTKRNCDVNKYINFKFTKKKNIKHP